MSVINLGAIVSQRTLELIEINKRLVNEIYDYRNRGLNKFATELIQVNKVTVAKINRYEGILDQFIATNKG